MNNRRHHVLSPTCPASPSSSCVAFRDGSISLHPFQLPSLRTLWFQAATFGFLCSTFGQSLSTMSRCSLRLPFSPTSFKAFVFYIPHPSSFPCSYRAFQNLSLSDCSRSHTYYSSISVSLVVVYRFHHLSSLFWNLATSFCVLVYHLSLSFLSSVSLCNFPPKKRTERHDLGPRFDDSPHVPLMTCS